MADTNDNNVTQLKNVRSKASIRESIENELREARLKEFRGALKNLVVKKSAADSVVKGIEAEIQALSEEYADVLPEQ